MDILLKKFADILCGALDNQAQIDSERDEAGRSRNGKVQQKEIRGAFGQSKAANVYVAKATD